MISITLSQIYRISTFGTESSINRVAAQLSSQILVNLISDNNPFKIVLNRNFGNKTHKFLDSSQMCESPNQQG